MEILGDVATVKRGHEMGLINHYNIRRVIDIYGAVQDRDLGAVSQDVEKIVNANQKLLPRGSFISVRGQVQTMRSSTARCTWKNEDRGHGVLLFKTVTLWVKRSCSASQRSTSFGSIFRFQKCTQRP
jgi:hypothetical protein